MRRIEKVQVDQETVYCDICNEKLGVSNQYNRERMAVIDGLIGKGKLDAHPSCVNAVIRKAFEGYLQ